MSAARSDWAWWPAVTSVDRSSARARWTAALVILFLVVGVYYVGVKGTGRSAINRWSPQVRALWNGEDIYLRYGFPTPPVMALVLTPFCCLPGAWVMGSWFVFKGGLTALAIRWSLKWSEEAHGKLTASGLVLAAALFVRPVMGDLLHGNVNLWILFLVLAAVASFRRGADMGAGLLLSLGVACKLTPMLLVVYFAWKRAWGVVGWSLLGLVLWWLLVPGLVFGFERHWELLTHWADYMVWPYVRDGSMMGEQTNQSAGALFHRLVTPIAAIRAEGVEGDSIAALTLRPETARWVWSLVSAVLVASVFWSCRGRWKERTSGGYLHELGMVYLTMLLVSERSWKHHFVWLVPIGLVLVGAYQEFATSSATQGRSRWILGLLVMALLACMSTSQDLVRPLAGEYGAKMMQAYGAYVWASAALLVAHGIVLGHLARKHGEGVI